MARGGGNGFGRKWNSPHRIATIATMTTDAAAHHLCIFLMKCLSPAQIHFSAVPSGPPFPRHNVYDKVRVGVESRDHGRWRRGGGTFFASSS